MIKILNSLGLAIIGIALLAGSAMAAGDTQGATVGGCLMTTDYLSLASATPAFVETPDLGRMSSIAEVQASGGALHVVAEPAWDLTVTDANSGYLKNGLTPLSSPLAIKVDTGDFVALDGSKKILGSIAGETATDCEGRDVTFDYQQPIVADDLTAGVQGEYSISLTYTLGPHGV